MATVSENTLVETLVYVLTPLQKRIETLEAELAAVKKSAPTHRGKFEKGRVYDVGNEVCWKGSTWRARYDKRDSRAAVGSLDFDSSRRCARSGPEMMARLCGPMVQDPETGEFVAPAVLGERNEKRTAERLAALRQEIHDRRPATFGAFRELQDRVAELERRLDALSAAE